MSKDADHTRTIYNDWLTKNEITKSAEYIFLGQTFFITQTQRPIILNTSA